jgi:hypothetical protein
MPLLPWKSGALAPRKTRRINNGLQPQWSPVAAIGIADAESTPQALKRGWCWKT